jgi:hypothetical protein
LYCSGECFSCVRREWGEKERREERSRGEKEIRKKEEIQKQIQRKRTEKSTQSRQRETNRQTDRDLGEVANDMVSIIFVFRQKIKQEGVHV